MPFRVVSGGRSRMSVLDAVEIAKGEGVPMYGLEKDSIFGRPSPSPENMDTRPAPVLQVLSS